MLSAAMLAATLTIADYATMPQPSSPRWSPDGTRIAYVLTKANLETSAYDPAIHVIGADGANDMQLARGSQPRWAPDGQHIAFVRDNDLFVIDIRGGEARRLVDGSTAVRELGWSPDGKSIAFLRLDEPTAEQKKREKEKDDAHVVGQGLRYVHLHLVDVASGESRQLTHGDFSIFTFDWFPDGTRLVFDRGPGAGLDDFYRTDLYTVSVRDGVLHPLLVRRGLDRAPKVSPDGKWIAFLSSRGIHDWVVEHELHVISTDGGTPRLVAAEYDRSPEQFSWDGDRIVFDGPFNSTAQLYAVNADGSGFTNLVKRDGVVSESDARGGRAVFVWQSLTTPPELYTLDGQLTHHNDEYRNAQLGETRVLHWKNPQDGLEIEGLLTLPVGYKAGTRVPLLTFAHGGPASQFNQAFLGYLGTLYVPQVFAARGFAVLRPNPRGTGGYGSQFRRANRDDWGGKDWIDINAGIDRVIADGIADPERLGLMGWSYGGFMASWALGHSDRFKAISIGAPVVDLLSFHGTTDIRDFLPHYFDATPSLDELRHAPLSLDLLREHSPLWHLKKTTARVLIQHGEMDDRVPVTQGTMLYRILDELGVDVKMVLYPRSGHVPREPKLRMDVARRNVEFFEPLLSHKLLHE
ncbi:MAG TPA: S9 family peptidase [Thermoanaerobaculia bacterium]|nr:S9 family peptidase [Thermoanaerobaculia bacterium]